MAKRRLFQYQYSFQRDLVHIFADVTFGSSGAPTLVSGKGISSITRLSAGKFQIQLQDPFAGVMMVSKVNKMASGAPASPVMVLNDVSNISQLTGGLIVLTFETSGGTATDPASGEEILMHIILKNTTA